MKTFYKSALALLSSILAVQVTVASSLESTSDVNVCPNLRCLIEDEAIVGDYLKQQVRDLAIQLRFPIGLKQFAEEFRELTVSVRWSPKAEVPVKIVFPDNMETLDESKMRIIFADVGRPGEHIIYSCSVEAPHPRDSIIYLKFQIDWAAVPKIAVSDLLTNWPLVQVKTKAGKIYERFAGDGVDYHVVVDQKFSFQLPHYDDLGNPVSYGFAEWRSFRSQILRAVHQSRELERKQE